MSRIIIFANKSGQPFNLKYELYTVPPAERRLYVSIEHFFPMTYNKKKFEKNVFFDFLTLKNRKNVSRFA